MRTRGTGCCLAIIMAAALGSSAKLRYVVGVNGEPVACVGGQPRLEGWRPGHRHRLDARPTRRSAPQSGEQRPVRHPAALPGREPGRPRAGADLRRLGANWQVVHAIRCGRVSPSWTAPLPGTVYASAGFRYLGDSAGFRRQARGMPRSAIRSGYIAAAATMGLRAPMPRVCDTRAGSRRTAGGPHICADW